MSKYGMYADCGCWNGCVNCILTLEECRRFHSEGIYPNKPPLGATPSYVAAEQRIHELAEAIARSSIDDPHRRASMSAWAKEIVEQISLINRLEEDKS